MWTILLLKVATMKIKLLIYAFTLVLIFNNSAFAKDLSQPSQSKNNIDLSEIALDNTQIPEEFEPISPTGSASAAIEANLIQTTRPKPQNASPLQSSLEETYNKTPENEKRIFQIFDLKGGVEKTNPEPENRTEETALQRWLTGDYATGEWFGARPLLEEHGVYINSSLLYGPFVKTRGGISNQRNGKGYTLYNLSVTVDTEQAGLWKGGTFYGLYQSKRGYGISGANGDGGAMGDWIGLDGWDWRQMNEISEYWYQQTLFDEKIRLKVGRQDGNSDFCFLNSGFDFINTAFSINPTVPIPTYPDQAFGFMAEFNPTKWLSLRNGIYSRYGSPFNISEIEVKPIIKKLPGRYTLGAWELSESGGFEVAAGKNSSGETYYNNFNRNFGVYGGFEQMVYKENKDDDEDMQGLTVFGQFGISPSEKNDMSKYFGAGLHYRGPIPKRDMDIAGLAVASGSFASRLAHVGIDYGTQEGSETAIECFYRFHVTPWFYLQPDVQLIMNPSGAYNSSVAIGIRSVITF